MRCTSFQQYFNLTGSDFMWSKNLCRYFSFTAIYLGLFKRKRRPRRACRRRISRIRTNRIPRVIVVSNIVWLFRRDKADNKSMIIHAGFAG
jgi:hypothetical protein